MMPLYDRGYSSTTYLCSMCDPCAPMRPAELTSAPDPDAVAGCALLVALGRQKQAWIGRQRRRRRRSRR